MSNIYIDYFKSPIGWIEVKASDKAVTFVSYVQKLGVSNSNLMTDSCISQLEEYFLGQRQEFDLLLYFNGTLFQKNVWNALQIVLYGKTCSYFDIAIKVNSPKAVRAVGNTNRINPISIIIPCHRVIGKNKNLVGYAGGIDKKEWLLNHEKKFI